MVPPGAIQVTGAGQPVVLLADRQTTGGYVKPFVVATAALGRMGQFMPGDHVHFELCTLAEAHDMLMQQKAARERLMCLRGAWCGGGRRGILDLRVDGDQHIIQWRDITETEGDDGTDDRSQ
jgi:hypothetical protein